MTSLGASAIIVQLSVSPISQKLRHPFFYSSNCCGLPPSAVYRASAASFSSKTRFPNLNLSWRTRSAFSFSVRSSSDTDVTVNERVSDTLAEETVISDDSGDENRIDVPEVDEIPRYIENQDVVSKLPGSQQEISSLKIELLAMVAGLDRGLSASGADVQKVDEVASKLEAVGGEVKLLHPDESEESSKALQLLQGRWRLVYSSGFATGSLGGRRPGPPFQLVLPVFTLGQVYQRIDVLAKELDNIVDFRLTSPIQPPPVITATLAHTFRITGDNSIEIIFEKTSVKPGGWEFLSQLPPLDLPQLPPDFLRPSQRLRSGSFNVTFLDDRMRITRGDRGELRVFVLA